MVKPDLSEYNSTSTLFSPLYMNVHNTLQAYYLLDYAGVTYVYIYVYVYMLHDYI